MARLVSSHVSIYNPSNQKRLIFGLAVSHRNESATLDRVSIRSSPQWEYPKYFISSEVRPMHFKGWLIRQ